MSHKCTAPNETVSLVPATSSAKMWSKLLPSWMQASATRWVRVMRSLRIARACQAVRHQEQDRTIRVFVAGLCNKMKVRQAASDRSKSSSGAMSQKVGRTMRKWTIGLYAMRSADVLATRMRALLEESAPGHAATEQLASRVVLIRADALSDYLQSVQLSQAYASPMMVIQRLHAKPVLLYQEWQGDFHPDLGDHMMSIMESMTTDQLHKESLSPLLCRRQAAAVVTQGRMFVNGAEEQLRKGCYALTSTRVVTPRRLCYAAAVITPLVKRRQVRRARRRADNNQVRGPFLRTTAPPEQHPQVHMTVYRVVANVIITGIADYDYVCRHVPRMTVLCDVCLMLMHANVMSQSWHSIRDGLAKLSLHLPPQPPSCLIPAGVLTNRHHSSLVIGSIIRQPLHCCSGHVQVALHTLDEIAML